MGKTDFRGNKEQLLNIHKSSVSYVIVETFPVAIFYFSVTVRSSNSAIRPLRFKFPLALKSHQHVVGGSQGKAAAPRQGTWLQHKREQLLQPWETQLQQQTVCTEWLQGLLLAAHTGTHPTNTLRRGARSALGDKQRKSLRETTDFVLRAETQERQGRRRAGDRLLKEQAGFLCWHPQTGQGFLPCLGVPAEDTRMGPVSREQPHSPSPIPGSIPQQQTSLPPALSGERTWLTQSRAESFTPASNGAGQDVAPFFWKTFNLRCSPILHTQDSSDILTLRQILSLYQATPVHRALVM